jgi:LacI family transcriptional regulator
MVSDDRRKRTARLEDIAHLAGVSVATVDRVFNERESVASATRSKVLAAARTLKVRRILPDSHHGVVHIEVLLPTNQTPFYRRLNRAFQRNIAILDKRILVHRTFIAENDEEQFVKAIAHPSFPRQGLIISAPDTNRVRQALSVCSKAGEPLASVVSDVSDVAGLTYVGIDNFRAGRTAGLVLGRFARNQGEILLLSGKQAYRGHPERIAGFRDGVARANHLLSCAAAPIETRDDDNLCYTAVKNALRSGRVIAGIYNSGAGSAGIEAALTENGESGKVIWVTHEMSDDHRAYLESGALDMVIDQNPEGQAITALQHILHSGKHVEDTVAPLAQTEFRLYFAANSRSSPYLE